MKSLYVVATSFFGPICRNVDDLFGVACGDSMTGDDLVFCAGGAGYVIGFDNHKTSRIAERDKKFSVFMGKDLGIGNVCIFGVITDGDVGDGSDLNKVTVLRFWIWLDNAKYSSRRPENVRAPGTLLADRYRLSQQKPAFSTTQGHISIRYDSCDLLFGLSHNFSV